MKEISKEKFLEICKKANSIADIIRECGLRVEGGNYKTIKRRIKLENIDISHIKLGLSSNRGRKFETTKVTKEEFLSRIKNGEQISRKFIKQKVVEFDLLNNKKCAECGCGTEWNAKPLILQLDHINGNPDDNNLENLRFLCPNCHSQTETFSGKQKKLERKKKYFCKCGKQITKTACRCSSCQPTKIEWPSAEILKQLIWSKPRSRLSKELGVSAVAIAKKCKQYNIEQPPRGYWTKFNYGDIS